MQAEQFAGISGALAAIPGVVPEPCDGQGHPIEGAAACLHLKITLPSPQREELLGQVAPLVRRAKFVLAALVARRDLYSLSLHPGPRGVDVPAALTQLEALLADPAQLTAGIVPDRRGR